LSARRQELARVAEARSLAARMALPFVLRRASHRAPCARAELPSAAGRRARRHVREPERRVVEAQSFADWTDASLAFRSVSHRARCARAKVPSAAARLAQKDVRERARHAAVAQHFATAESASSSLRATAHRVSGASVPPGSARQRGSLRSCRRARVEPAERVWRKANPRMTHPPRPAQFFSPKARAAERAPALASLPGRSRRSEWWQVCACAVFSGDRARPCVEV